MVLVRLAPIDLGVTVPGPLTFHGFQKKLLFLKKLRFFVNFLELAEKPKNGI